MKKFRFGVRNGSLAFLFLAVISFSYVFAVESVNSGKQNGIELEKKINETPWLGIITKDYLKEKVRKKESEGVLVDDFIEKGPAMISGINKGDVIRAVDGQPVMNQNEFENIIYAQKVGNKIKVKLTRNGEEIEIEVVLENAWNKVKEVLNKLGFNVQIVEVPDKPINIIISDIKKDSVSFDAKLEEGDLLLGINRKIFRTLKEFGEIVSQVKLNETVFITIIHNGAVLTKELSMNVAESKK